MWGRRIEHRDARRARRLAVRESAACGGLAVCIGMPAGAGITMDGEAGTQAGNTMRSTKAARKEATAS